MAFSTKHYHVKPIAPPIKMGLSFNGIILRKFNARSALLLSEPFLQSSQFYYNNDSSFAEKLKEYTRKLEVAKEELLRQTFRDFRHGHSNSIEFETEIETINKILNRIVYMEASPSAPCYDNQNLIEDVASSKELHIWLKKHLRSGRGKSNLFTRKKNTLNSIRF